MGDTMKKDISFLYDIRIAHRGLHDHKIKENTIAAFKKALEKEIPIELDLHLLKDNQIIVFHDDTLKRLFHVDKKVKDCTYEEIKAYGKKVGINVPLFQEVLDLVCGKVLLDIEFKYDRFPGLLEKRASLLLDKYRGPFLVKSFHPLSVIWFRVCRPTYIRGQLAEDVCKDRKWTGKLLTSMCFHFLTKPDFIAYEKKGSILKRVQKLRKKVPILLYTIRSTHELEKYGYLGDGYICENILE